LERFGLPKLSLLKPLGWDWVFTSKLGFGPNLVFLGILGVGFIKVLSPNNPFKAYSLEGSLISSPY